VFAGLDKEFNFYFEKISTLKNVAPDVMLRFYAYNKQATAGNNYLLNAGSTVRNAFKFNAWVQLAGMTEDEAKQEYINLAKIILKN